MSNSKPKIFYNFLATNEGVFVNTILLKITKKKENKNNKGKLKVCYNCILQKNVN